jgi:alginate O-acetyltransferase complex protein AlgI
VLFLFKYSNFFVANLNAIGGFHLPNPNIFLPLGVSFNAFQSMSYIVDVYKRTTTCEKSYYNYLTYTTLFPQVIAGPIVRYVTVEDEIEDRTIKFDNFSKGIRRFLIGLAKKVLIANSVGALWNVIKTGGVSDMSVATYWIGILAFTLQIYFDFSGYSDMAIGLAEVFGLTFDENFNYPYISRSITEFWRRWHMTLSAWFRDYVYIPLGGNRKGKWLQIRNILIVWALTGLWHGASWNFVLWGVYFSLLLIFEKFVLFKFWEKVFRPIQHLYTIFLVVMSWVIFEFEDLKAMGAYFKGLFGFGGVPLFNGHATYFVAGFALIFVLAAGLCTPFFRNQLGRLEKSEKKWAHVAATAAYVFMFVASTAYLVNSTYNPFLYFRF